MNVEDENISTLLSMGFPDIREIKRALHIAKNDLNEAVAILTNDQSSGYSLDVQDVDLEDISVNTSVSKSGVVSSNLAPPPYEKVVQSETGCSPKEDSNLLEFPTTNLYELEGRVFTDSWSIPYKKEESLGKCLIAAIHFAEAGLCEADENCRRFMDRCMPEAFKKLLTSAAVRRWGPEIQEGIFNMLELLIDLVVARLKNPSVPELLLYNTLAMAFDPECEWNVKNKTRRWNVLHWENVFGQSSAFAVSPPASLFQDPNGWLVDLINRFAEKGGFDLIQKKFEDDISASAMAALLLPLGLCAEHLNSTVVCSILSPCMDKAIAYIRGLQENDLKHKKIGGVTDLLLAMKFLCIHLWPTKVELMNNLRLEITLRMLKSPHFNSKMNGLKEVIKLIDESTNVKNSKMAIDTNRILDWMADSKVLSIALEGNIDHVQYTERIKAVVEFLGPRLSLDELTKIWKMQEDQNNQVVDNIYAIMAAASAKFNAQQFDHLFTLIQKSWQDENVGMREKLLTLIGKIGREARPGKTSTKVLDLLWDLAHLPSLPTHLIEQALEEHMSILNDPAFKDQVRKNYITKCVEDIKKGFCVLPAIKQLHNIARSIAKPSIHKQDKAALSDLNKTHDVVKLLTVSLMKCHKLAVSVAGEKTLTADTAIDNRYTHREYLNCHLHFLQFMLQEGDLYLPWNRCKDIWDTLVATPDACEFDKEVCFDWFSRCLEDLEPDTRSQFFQQKLLKLDPAQVTMKAFTCFKTYFESINIEDRKLKRVGNSVIVEKLDPTGIDYFWQVVLYAQNEEIADTAIDNILQFSYLSLAPRLKKDPIALHKKFINDCYKRLEAAMMTLSGSAMSTAVSSATKTLTAMSVAEVASLPLPSRSVQLQNIRRLLLIAEQYISIIEEMHTAPRTILPHGAAFQGHPITMHITTCEGTKQEFSLIVHSNETLWSVRQKIAQQLKINADHIQIAANDKILTTNKDQKLLGQLNFDDEQHLVIKINSSATVAQSNPHQTSQVKEIQDSLCLDEIENNYGPSAASASVSIITPTNRQSFNFEQEKMLPGVVMSTGGQVFEMLYQLTELEDPKIIIRVRNLLRLIPTDPSIQDALDSLGAKEITRGSPPVDVSPRASPRSSPKKMNLSREKETPFDVLKSLFDAQSMPPFRVLYNLEVLSSKLMPTSNDAGTLHSAHVFCEEFLNIGGLRLVINILQKDAMPVEVDYDTRQGCYFTALQLARFLLCGQTITGNYTPASPLVTKVLTKKFFSNGFAQSSVTPNAASKAIQTMGMSDFTDTLICFMRVAWAAAAGRLYLANSVYIARESSVYLVGPGRSRQSSTGSNASSGSEGENQTLHAGVCSQNTQVMSRDSLIAREALELLVTCLQLRSQNLVNFYNLNCIGDFIIDTLLGSPNVEIRNKACEQFYRLSQINIVQDGVLSPHHFVLQILRKAHLPLWVPSSSARGTNQRLLGQCSQYFDLLCRLLHGLSVIDQQQLQIFPSQMMEDEVAWLQNFTPSEHPSLLATDCTLLAGHLRLIQTLLTCQGIDKKMFGENLILDLLNSFLFPASRLISDGLSNSSTTNDQTFGMVPKCSGIEAKVAAYDLLEELSKGCVENIEKIVHQLIHLHHTFSTDLAKEFEYEPLVAGRPSSGYVGLKNAGATCYMNSVIQQLYLVPGVREAILAVDEEDVDDDTVFHQLQTVFGHLLESRLQYYVPSRFWKCFKLWGQPVNVREQQDAFEFFMHLIDQVDEHLKTIKREQIFKNTFEGLFSNQMICQDCPHRYEREESFTALNVTVKSHNLQESLEQFVRGEILEGDNAYFCEKCGEKRTTIKRTCIKSLSSVLVIHLKRFDYDWEANRALKFDDHFKFPWILDMGPFMAERVQDKEKSQKNDPNSLDPISLKTNLHPTSYELVGVVVHSGQANAGHYYSFIKERRGDSLTNPNLGKWFKFNDISVEEFEMNDMSLEAECFGGTYKAKVYDPSNSYPEVRQRYWNGYMLFYEKMEESIKTPRTPSAKTPLRRSFVKMDGDGKMFSPTLAKRSSANKDSDGLSQLTELVHHGDRQGIFQDKMPARIQQMVREENLRFMQNRDVYSDEYFNFIHQLVTCDRQSQPLEDFGTHCILSCKLAVYFLLNTYFRTKKKNPILTESWMDSVDSILIKSKEATFWLLGYFAQDSGLAYIKPMLIECPNKDVRNAFMHILQKVLECFYKHEGDLTTHQHNVDILLEYLLKLLGKDIPDNCRTCNQYFELLTSYTQMGSKACLHLFKHDAFSRLLAFLLGPVNITGDPQDILPRRWSSVQCREFGGLHTILAVLILSCDLTPFRSCAPDNCPERTSTWVISHRLPMPIEIQSILFTPKANWYIREVINACREVSGSLSAITDMLMACSFCNQNFSTLVLQHIMLQYASVSSNELKHIFQVLLDLLTLEDPLQFTRLQYIIDGYVDKTCTTYEGMLAIIKLNHISDSRRSYQCIKFLVHLANKSPLAKDYLMQTPSRWQWAVNWLKRKMTEHSYWNPPSTPLSNEDSNSHNFQRTMSAQDTLAEATALLTEAESPDNQHTEMDINCTEGEEGEDWDKESCQINTGTGLDLDS